MPTVFAGIDLFYDIRGAGPRLLFISGTGGDLRKAPTAFDRLLDAQFEVLRFDQRGMGQSAKPDEPYSMVQYADDAAALLSALGWSAVPVLGYSFGGMVAQELALRHPGCVTRLALLCTTAGGAGGASWPMHTLADWPLEARAAKLLALGDTRRDAAWQAAHRALYQAMRNEILAGLRLGGDDPHHALGAQRQLDARAQHDTWDRLPGLAVPVAVFGGRHDGIAAPRCVENLARRVPGAQLELFDGGHLVHVQNAAAGKAVVDWLGRSANGAAC